MSDTENNPRKNLIDDLVADLKPVQRPGRVGFSMAIWLLAAVAYSLTIMLATGPLRPDALSHLIEHPWFALETLVAAATITLACFAALALTIPGRGNPRKLLAIPLVLLGGWLTFYLVGLVAPAHPVSMDGKRDHCVLQGILFSLPNLVALLALARRYYPVWPRATAAAAGLASAAIPAALMQFGCMYAPDHILTHHMAPILATVALGAIIGPWVLSPRRPVPRGPAAPLH